MSVDTSLIEKFLRLCEAGTEARNIEFFNFRCRILAAADGSVTFRVDENISDRLASFQPKRSNPCWRG